MKTYPSEYICSECGELWPDTKAAECPGCHAKMDVYDPDPAIKAAKKPEKANPSVNSEDWFDSLDY